MLQTTLQLSQFKKQSSEGVVLEILVPEKENKRYCKSFISSVLDSGVFSILFQIRNRCIGFMLQSDLDAHKFYSRRKLSQSCASRM